ncbi:MAG TPA: peptidase domain-containing ABC transporter, partial [Prolixibacteraceae bacterium]|nr:peptidase domain-containing ABC transporter [Prolixibacteraceae bacterium]
MERNRIKKTFIHQLDQTDCGVACLQSILRFHGGYCSMERLRELSGTSKQGTTLLGLYQAANQLGLQAQGYEADFSGLKKMVGPVILHVIMDNGLNHFVVCYGYEKDHYLIGDPGKGIDFYSEKALSDIWKSHSALELIPTQRMETAERISGKKRMWLFSEIKKDAGALGIIFGLSIVTAVLGLALAIFSQKLIDDILPNKNTMKLIVGLVLVFILLFLRGWMGYIEGFFRITQGKDFNNRLIGQFFGSLLYLPKTFFDNRSLGELVERLNDTERIQSAISILAGDLLRSLLLVLAGEALLFYYSPITGIVSLMAIPVFIGISIAYNKRIVSRQHEVMVANANKSGNYVQTIRGVGTLKCYNRESDFDSLNRNIYASYQDKIFCLGKTGLSLQFISESVSVFFMVLVMATSSTKVLTDHLSLGSFMAILNMCSILFPSIVSLSFANLGLQGARVAFDRMFEFMSIAPESSSNETEGSSVPVLPLRMEGLSFRFPGRKLLLNNISFFAEKGEWISIIGESGCGKTTLLNIIQRFYEHDYGSVFANGISIQEIPVSAWRKKLGIVEQDVCLFNSSVVENICFSTKTEDVRRCVQFCVTYGFHDYFMKFPNNYATLLGENGIKISGGQKQLIGLARALWSQPQLLLLDEPTSSLDRDTERFVLDLLI